MKRNYNIHPLFKDDIQHAKTLLAKKDYTLDVEMFTALNEKRLSLLQEAESYKKEINTLSKSTPRDNDFIQNIARSKELKTILLVVEQDYAVAEEKFVDYFCAIPNFLTPVFQKAWMNTPTWKLNVILNRLSFHMILKTMWH